MLIILHPKMSWFAADGGVGAPAGILLPGACGLSQQATRTYSARQQLHMPASGQHAPCWIVGPEGPECNNTRICCIRSPRALSIAVRARVQVSRWDSFAAGLDKLQHISLLCSCEIS